MIPGGRPVSVFVVPPFDHKYVYGGVPEPFVITVTVPVGVAQTLVPEFIEIDNGVGSVIVVDEVEVQELASVTVTV
jgi:hypothetical protein